MTTPHDGIRQRELARIELSALVEVAQAITGWAWSDPEYGSAANISGIRTRQDAGANSECADQPGSPRQQRVHFVAPSLERPPGSEAGLIAL